MQRSASAANALARQILRHQTHVQPLRRHQPCDVFINHRRIDTNKNISGLLYDQISRMGLRAFLDSKTMKPGDKLFDKIDTAIRECKVGIAVFSPSYCESYFCLHELALIMECKKRVVPIFVDVKPSELQVVDDGNRPAKELLKFRKALEEAKNTVGLTFDSLNGDWSELLTSASDAVMANLIEVEEDRSSSFDQLGGNSIN
ncbi:TIR-only protein-like [Diospyros lotus]|uniref:TIR-only protein-like n=1 Tax=Diospyros lotus TaxID=55363 RepID=UPI0022593A6B|nr:TIR-only protein-like [Diospyros lotus]